MKPPTVKKADNPLLFGILGAARIAPDSLLTPAKSHADVVVAAVACRDKNRGDKYAKSHDCKGHSEIYGHPDLSHRHTLRYHLPLTVPYISRPLEPS